MARAQNLDALGLTVLVDPMVRDGVLGHQAHSLQLHAHLATAATEVVVAEPVALEVDSTYRQEETVVEATPREGETSQEVVKVFLVAEVVLALPHVIGL